MAPLTYEVIDDFDRSALWQPALWPLVVIAPGWGVGFALDRGLFTWHRSVIGRRQT
ncbi:MAG: hypothetical protein R3C68_02200 [Myxococcota bacterium]